MVQQLRLTFTEPEGAPADPEKRIVGSVWYRPGRHSHNLNHFLDYQKRIYDQRTAIQITSRCILQKRATLSPAQLKDHLIAIGVFPSSDAVELWVNTGNVGPHIRMEEQILEFVDSSRDALYEILDFLATGIAKTPEEAWKMHRESTRLEYTRAWQEAAIFNQPTPPSPFQSSDSSLPHILVAKDVQ